MKLSKTTKIIISVFILVGLGALLIWGFMEGRKELAMEQERERPVKAPLRVSTERGESIVTLDEATQAKSGIAVEPLTTLSHRGEVRAYGTVLQVQEMVDLYNNYAASKAQFEKAKASLYASKREYERLKKLNADNKNISDKALQNSESTWRSDEAALVAARDTLRNMENAAVQRWGRVVAKRLVEGSSSFQRLAGLKDVLIQVTFPPDSGIKKAPEKIRVSSASGASGATIAARFISTAPRTDPRIQGMSFLYIASSDASGLIPGMNIVALLPVGPLVQGVIVPNSAVVLWQGKGWAYIRRDANRFARVEVPMETPVKDGWFVSKGFSASDKVVVRGAQLLLSEELRSQIQVGEEGNK